ncbi:MAG TPA: PLP-dependent cysteine synthase family protein [Gemmatimonadales bacterium]|nr:PLP-dependent cysteine synthase family protein [Gemmatimonadales bacterium]
MKAATLKRTPRRAPARPRRNAPRAAREPALWRLVGNTPLLALPPAEDDGGTGALWLKAEWLNPGGSVKDRAALFILRDGIARGALPGKRLLDASSGNTAIAYAMLGAAAGIGVTVCVPANASAERTMLLELYGAEVRLTDPLEGSDGAIRAARDLAAQQPERYWYADQYSHPANPRAHYVTTAEEIWRQTEGRITHLVAGLGTTGTLMGTGRRLKELNPRIELVGVQPDGPFHGLEGLKHLATALVPSIYDPSLVDRTEFVATEAAEHAVRRLAHRGLSLGWSTGAALVAAERIRAATRRPHRDRLAIVVVAPDSGARYLSERRRLGGGGTGEGKGEGEGRTS